MDFGSAYLFNKKPEDMRRLGALGARARVRNLRLRKARQAPVTRELSRPCEETAAEAIRRIDALCPWLVGVERREVRRRVAKIHLPQSALSKGPATSNEGFLAPPFGKHSLACDSDLPVGPS